MGIIRGSRKNKDWNVRKKRGQGFTLIEVVVAIAILGIGLTIMMELFSGGLRLGRTSVEYTKAVDFARMKMEELLIQPSFEEGITEGKWDGMFHWRAEIKRMDILPPGKDVDFKPPVDLFHFSVNVLWSSGAKERTIGFESYKTLKIKDEEKKS